MEIISFVSDAFHKLSTKISSGSGGFKMIGINKSHTLISHLFLLDSNEIKITRVSYFSDVSFEEKRPQKSQ